MVDDKKDNRPNVRAERIDTKCGYIGHMTVDQIKERSFGENVNAACPECGKIHFTIDDIEEAEARKLSENNQICQNKIRCRNMKARQSMRPVYFLQLFMSLRDTLKP